MLSPQKVDKAIVSKKKSAVVAIRLFHSVECKWMNGKTRVRAFKAAFISSLLFLVLLLVVSAALAPSIEIARSNRFPSSSFNWKNRWWTRKSVMFPKLRSSGLSCPLCSFSAATANSNSSQRDVVLIVVVGEVYGLPTTIRSLRTSKINAHCVVLADSQAFKKIRSQFAVLADQCGVTVIDIGSMSYFERSGLYRTRWHIIYEFLATNPGLFDRFIITDAYDSFFQGDPFLPSLKSDYVYFSTETINIIESPINMKWLDDAFPGVVNSIGQEPIICAGPILGGIEPLMKMLEYMFSLPQWASNWTYPPDQAHINYMVWTGGLEKAGVRYEVVNNGGFITTVGFCNRKQPLRVDSLGNIGCPNANETPLLIHQYIRIRAMKEHVQAVCPPNGVRYAFKENPYSQEKLGARGAR